jgi:hypothetical protein
MREDSNFFTNGERFAFAEPKEQDMPETPPMIKTSNINYSLLFIFSSIFLEVLKSKRIKTAQKDAEIPIKATTLSP